MELNRGPRTDSHRREGAHAVNAQGRPVPRDDEYAFLVPLEVEVRRPHAGPRDTDIGLLMRANDDRSLFACDEIEDPHRFVEAHLEAKRTALWIWNG
jgi:hypothetical protein